MKNCIVLLSLLVASPLCHALSHHVPSLDDEELAGAVINEENPEISFDETLQELNLTSFRTLLIQEKLFDELNNPNKSHTVFAPTNKAIMNAPKSLFQPATRALEVLKYHVHPGAFRTSMIEENMRLKTMLGGQQKIRFERYKGVFYGSCQPFGSVTDRTYNNGILDTMNGVMVPPEGNIYNIIKGTATFSSFLKYADKGRLQQMLQNPTPMTLLIPNDDAFGKLPDDVTEKLNTNYRYLHKVLEYHILTEIICSAGFETGPVQTYEGDDINVAVSGSKIVFNSNSTLIQPDIIAFNGVMHVIDKVLLPPAGN